MTPLGLHYSQSRRGSKIPAFPAKCTFKNEASLAPATSQLYRNKWYLFFTEEILSVTLQPKPLALETPAL